MHKNIKEGNAYLKQLCEQKGIPAPQHEYNVRVLNTLISMVESAPTKSGQAVTQFHDRTKATTTPTIKASAAQFSAKNAPLNLTAETPEEMNARFRARRENSPEANGAWIRAMVKAGTVSAPTNFAEAVKDFQALGCSKGDAVATAVHAYPEVHAKWLEESDTHTL